MERRIRPGLGQEELTAGQLRKFAWILAGMILLFGAVLVPWRWDINSLPGSVLVAAILAVRGTVAPMTLKRVYAGWERLGHGLGWVNSRIILAVLFFVVVTPTAIILKLLGKDPMKRRYDPEAKSYRTTRRPFDGPDHFERPY